MTDSSSIESISPADVATLREQPNVLVVDVRPPFSYCGGRIPGSINLPGVAITRRKAEIGLDRKLIFVDDDGADVVEAAQAALDAGFADVSILEGGFDAWQDADLPTETVSEGFAPPIPPQPR